MCRCLILFVMAGCLCAADATAPAVAHRYAEIRAGVVFNVAMWDGLTVWLPGADVTLVQLDDNSSVCQGWTWDGKTFTAPVVVAPDP